MRVFSTAGGTLRARRLTPFATAAASLAAAPLALAQQPGSSETALEEIVVTATRIARPLDRVPAAVSVVSREEIQRAQQQLALDESLGRVPGLFMQNRYNFAQDLRVSIRGFGARANFGIRGIKILVDGIPETLPDGQGQVDSIDLGATEQIEIIRGPSSSLYGNAAGGVIAVTSESGQEPYAELRLSGGEFDFQKLQIKAGGQTERADYFLSLSDASLDGFRAQSRAENTQLTGRLRYDLGADRELLAVLNFTDQPVSDDPGALTAEQAAADPEAAFPANVNFDAGEELSQSRLGLVYTMPLGEGHELQARSYSVWRDFGNKLPFADGGIVDLDRFFTGGGVSYSYDGDWGDLPARLIVGVDFDDQDDERRRYTNELGAQGALTFDQNESVRSWGVFVQNELSLSERLDVTFGARFDEVEFDVTDRFLIDGDDSGNRSLDDVSPLIAFALELTPGASLYGTYSSAFETPTTTEFNNPSGGGGFNPDLDPQIARNLEVGVRGSLAERHRYEVALFHIEVEDELIPFEIPGSPGRDAFANAGRSTRDGVELSFTTRPTARLAATVSYTYSDFVFDEFVDGDGADFAGNTIPGTVEHLLFGGLTYTHPAGWYGAWDAVYVGDQFANNANSAVNESYVLASLRLGFERQVGGFAVAPFVGINNLFDETYNANVRINAFGGRFFEPGPGRNAYAGVALRHRFE